MKHASTRAGVPAAETFKKNRQARQICSMYNPTTGFDELARPLILRMLYAHRLLIAIGKNIPPVSLSSG